MISCLTLMMLPCYIWSMALYGAETWTLWAADQKYLEKYCRKGRQTDQSTRSRILTYLSLLVHCTIKISFSHSSVQTSNNANPVLVHLTSQSSNTAFAMLYDHSKDTQCTDIIQVPKIFCGVLFYFNL
jgi:hypothetical protein